MNFVKILRTAATAIAAATLLQTVTATQPVDDNVQVTSRLAFGSASFLEIKNLKRGPVTVGVRGGPMSTLQFPEQRVQIEEGGTALVNLGDLFAGARNPVQALHALITVTDRRGVRQDGPALYENLRVEGGVVKQIAYEEAYLSKQIRTGEVGDPVEADLGAGFVDRSPMPQVVFEAKPLDRPLPIEKFEAPGLEDMLKMEPNAVGDPGGVVAEGGGKARAAAMEGPFFGSAPAANLKPEPVEDPEETTKVTISGQFFLLTPNPAAAYMVKPAWAWSVQAFEWVGQYWKYRASAFVNSDGSWQAALNVADPKANLRIVYRPVNRFVYFRKPDGNAYAWQRHWSLANGTNTGQMTANLAADGDLPGLDQLYLRAMTLWSKMHTNGINPLMNHPASITYPNNLSTGECTTKDKDDKMIPWSCATTDKGIYIAPRHAFGGTAMHELAHLIHLHYWGKWPDGWNGDHSARKCYDAGLALTEGFANYIAYWTVSTPTNLDTSVRSNIDVESLDDEFCKGPTNEMRAAAVMWDTYDSTWELVDNNKADIWYYAKPSGFISLFLKNPKSSIEDYRPLMKQQPNLPSWFPAEVDRTFRLNTIIP